MADGPPSSSRRPAAERLPVLTEVVRVAGGAGTATDASDKAAPTGAMAPTAPMADAGTMPQRAAADVDVGRDSDSATSDTADDARPTPAAPSQPSPWPLDADEDVARVLRELQPRIDALFEARLREALAPALARVADGLIRDAREELAPALAELVRDAVARRVPPLD